MKGEAIKQYYIVNGELKSVSNSDTFQRIREPFIYEVIRVVSGVPLFLEDHIDRMRKSAELMGLNINREDGEIQKDIRSLIEENNESNLNVKLLYANTEEAGSMMLVYFIKSFYPPEEYYKKGIHTILFRHERDNPNAKVQKSSFRKKIAEELERKKAFEALLVNRDEYITEGSRSNMFFVKGDRIYTAPKGTVLLGITRKYILQVCNELNIEVVEENIHVDEIAHLDGAFMSGTSVNVLPIASIDDIKLDSVNNHIIKRVSDGYMNKMKSYIERKTL
ncbi:MAG: aminotransferase class IV [Tissierellia bacterium]|nr:aminotransferase class IV [Tissierellia bacterium]